VRTSLVSRPATEGLCSTHIGHQRLKPHVFDPGDALGSFKVITRPWSTCKRDQSVEMKSAYDPGYVSLVHGLASLLVAWLGSMHSRAL
jgi:hypothetical protein